MEIIGFLAMFVVGTFFGISSSIPEPVDMEEPAIEEIVINHVEPNKECAVIRFFKMEE